MAGLGEQTDIGPVIDILFNREGGELGSVDAASQLREIRVTIPTNVPEEMAITGTECDEVTASAMIRAEHEPGRGELTEGGRNVGARQARTIGTDNDDLFVAEAGEFFGGGIETVGEGRPALLVHLEAGEKHAARARGEEMEVRAAAGMVQLAEGKQRTQKLRPTPAGEVEPDRIGK